MSRIRKVLVSTLAAAGVACSLFTDSQQSSLDDAFRAAVTGFDQAQSTFASGSGGEGPAWMPAGRGEMRGGPGGRDMMCGGLDGAFMGAGFGPGFGHRPPSDATCVYSASTGRLTCPPLTRHGLTIARSLAYTDKAGNSQSAFDSLTTNTINTQIDVTGTVVVDGRGEHGFGPGFGPGRTTGTGKTVDTVTVHNTSDRTVSGLAQGSTQRTVNGTSTGQEDSKGSNDKGTFTASRTMGDTTTGLVIPIQSSGPTYPTAGTVIRSMKVTVTYAGQSPQSSSRREVITYDGSATAKVVLTKDGVTQNCTLPLPRGRLTCS